MHKLTSVFRKTLLTTAMVAGAGLGLSGCVLSPQVVELNETANVPAGELSQPRNALVRVVDQRGMENDLLGYRGGREPENSPLLTKTDLKTSLTNRLRSSLANVGFGNGTGADPVKVQLDVNTFNYQCNEGVMVNECTLDLTFAMTVMNGGDTFDKPYSISETRSVVASPAQVYNEEWVNEALDKIWGHIFKDPEFLRALGVR